MSREIGIIRLPLSHLVVDDPDERVATSQILFSQYFFNKLTIRRPGHAQKLKNGNKMLRELISSRPSGEIKNGLVEVEIEKLTLHNFTLQTPIQEIETNMVVSINKIHL